MDTRNPPGVGWLGRKLDRFPFQICFEWRKAGRKSKLQTHPLFLLQTCREELEHPFSLYTCYFLQMIKLQRTSKGVWVFGSGSSSRKEGISQSSFPQDKNC